jgi:hypothetical protein
MYTHVRVGPPSGVAPCILMALCHGISKAYDVHVHVSNIYITHLPGSDLMRALG